MQSLEVGGARRKNQHRAGGCVHQQRERLAVDEVDVGAPFAQRVAARDGPRRRGRLAQALEEFLRATKDGHGADRSEEHTSELQSLMRISYAVFCLKKKTKKKTIESLNEHE